MSKTDLSGVWGFKGTSQLAKLTELQGYREKSKKNSKPPTPPCTEPLKRYVSSVLVATLHRDGNIRLCPQHTQRRPSNSRERPRTIRSKFSPFWRNWVDSGVNYLGCPMASLRAGSASFYHPLPEPAPLNKGDDFDGGGSNVNLGNSTGNIIRRLPRQCPRARSKAGFGRALVKWSAI